MFMVFEVIHNESFNQPAGFTQHQFRRLDQLYCLAVRDRSLTDRAVDCDFDEGIASYTYYVANQHTPYLQFLIRRVGPRTVMFEVYKQGKGRIMKSGVFDRAYSRLKDEIESLST